MITRHNFQVWIWKPLCFDILQLSVSAPRQFKSVWVTETANAARGGTPVESHIFSGFDTLAFHKTRRQEWENYAPVYFALKQFLTLASAFVSRHLGFRQQWLDIKTSDPSNRPNCCKCLLATIARCLHVQFNPDWGDERDEMFSPPGFWLTGTRWCAVMIRAPRNVTKTARYDRFILTQTSGAVRERNQLGYRCFSAVRAAVIQSP